MIRQVSSFCVALLLLLPAGVVSSVRARLDDELEAMVQGIKPEALSYIRKQQRTRRTQEDSTIKLADEFGGQPGFYHGVMSGDMTDEAIVLWTRYTPENLNDEIEIEFRIAEITDAVPERQRFNTNSRRASMYMARGLYIATADSDFTVKVDITGLKPGTQYAYVFVETSTSESSRIGLTKTLPADNASIDSLTYAMFSCSAHAFGYFHAYEIGSLIEDLDFWVHLGDYIYEYGGWEGANLNEVPERYEMADPFWETISLNDYRRRYGLYMTDPALQNLAATAPLMVTFDDHEITNDAHGDGTVEGSGAENHQPECPVNRAEGATVEEIVAAACDQDEGSIIDRSVAGLQAFMEWLPLRRGPGADDNFYDIDITRTLEWGDLATFHIPDVRFTARTRTFDNIRPLFGFVFVNTDIDEYPTTFAPTIEGISSDLLDLVGQEDNVMIGADQEAAIMEAFSNSADAGKPWQVFVSALMLGQVILPDLRLLPPYVPNTAAYPTLQADLAAHVESVLPTPAAVWNRAGTFMTQGGLPFKGDDWNGFPVERARVLDICKDYANNCVFISGDFHDSFASVLYEGNLDSSGDAVGINLVCTAVASSSFGIRLLGATNSFVDSFPAADQPAIREAIALAMGETFVENNQATGLKYANVFGSGFTVVKMTPTHTESEFFTIRSATLETPYEEINGALAPFECRKAFTTTAGDVGSLDDSSCGTTQFGTEHPSVWDVPVRKFRKNNAPSSTYTDCGKDGCTVDADFGN